MTARVLIALTSALAMVGGGYWWGHTATDNAWQAKHAKELKAERAATAKETKRADQAAANYLTEHLDQEDRYAALNATYQDLRRRVPLVVPGPVVVVTLSFLPDIGSDITITHGTRLAYTDRSAQGAQVRAPEFAFMIDSEGEFDRIIPGTLSVTYPSGGVLRTVTDNGTGALTGAATGVVDYPSRSVLLRPTLMPDAGAELQIDCDVDALITENLAPGAPDAGGFISLALTQQPAAGTLALSWITARNTSATAGAKLTTTTATKKTDVTYTIRSVPEYYEPASSGGGVNWPRSS